MVSEKQTPKSVGSQFEPCDIYSQMTYCVTLEMSLNSSVPQYFCLPTWNGAVAPVGKAHGDLQMEGPLHI